MKRRQVFTGLASASAASALSRTALAAQGTDDIESRVDELESQMKDVLARLKDLEGGTSSDNGNAGQTATSASKVTGNGESVSDDFPLKEGRYQVHGTCTLGAGESDNFIVWSHGPGGADDLLFNEIVEGSFEGDVVLTVEQAGNFYVEVQTGGGWELSFKKR